MDGAPTSVQILHKAFFPLNGGNLKNMDDAEHSCSLIPLLSL